MALHEAFPQAPLFTSVYDKKLAPWADCFDVRTSFLQNLPLPKNAHEFYPFLMGIAFESFNFDEFDVVISVTHEFAKAIITKPQTTHICYCLNPVGYLWDSYDDYFSTKPSVFKALSIPLIKYLRWYDKIVAQRPDKYITISQTVQERARRIYGRESKVIYPPVDVKQESEIRNQEDGGYYLMVSRLAPQKRLDIAVKAFNQLGLPLKIVGTGNQMGNLKSVAKSNIEFLGFVEQEKLNQIYKGSRAVIIPGTEDFNIVAVEAQSFGKPVIAFRKGGVMETVIDGKTGWFFDEQTPASLVAAVKKNGKINPQDCWKNSQRFSKERFVKEILAYVRSA